MPLKARILILNYNGSALLRRFLPSFTKAVTQCRINCALTVIDNRSSDDSMGVLKNEFPSVNIFAAAENRVLCSYNEAARFYKEDVLIFMNNDIEVKPDFIDPLIDPFERGGGVFFVTPKVLAMDHLTYEGNRTKAEIRFGVFTSSTKFAGYEKGMDQPGPTFQGGFGAIDRHKFLELGGYDDLYLPGRLEDADLCFRAYQRGWKSIYEPRSVVYHEGGTSFHKRFGARRTLVINWRNTFLFMLKNLNDRMILLQFLLWLPVRLCYLLFRGEPEFLLGLVEFLPRWREAVRRRKMPKARRLRGTPSDRQIFKNSCEV